MILPYPSFVLHKKSFFLHRSSPDRLEMFQKWTFLLFVRLHTMCSYSVYHPLLDICLCCGLLSSKLSIKCRSPPLWCRLSSLLSSNSTGLSGRHAYCLNGVRTQAHMRVTFCFHPSPGICNIVFRKMKHLCLLNREMRASGLGKVPSANAVFSGSTLCEPSRLHKDML